MAALGVEVLAEVMIVSGLGVERDDKLDDLSLGDAIVVMKTTHHKCGRCWRLLPEVTEDGALCDRCADVVGHLA